MTGFALNPFSSSFVYSGTLSYYSQLFHYENYPELIYPIELVNIARWVQLPYRMIKGMVRDQRSKIRETRVKGQAEKAASYQN